MHRFNPNYKQTRLNIPIIDRINQKKKKNYKTSYSYIWKLKY